MKKVEILKTLKESFILTFRNRMTYLAASLVFLYGILSSFLLNLLYDLNSPALWHQILLYAISISYFVVLFFVLGRFLRSGAESALGRYDPEKNHGLVCFMYTVLFLLSAGLLMTIIFQTARFMFRLVLGVSALLEIVFLIGFAAAGILLVGAFFFGLAGLIVGGKKVFGSILESLAMTFSNMRRMFPVSLVTVLILAVGYWPTYFGKSFMGPFQMVVMFIDVWAYCLFVLLPTVFLLLIIAWIITFYSLYYHSAGEKD